MATNKIRIDRFYGISERNESSSGQKTLFTSDKPSGLDRVGQLISYGGFLT